GSNQTITGGAAGQLTMVGALDTTFKDTEALFNGDTIQGWAPGDLMDLTNLAFSSIGVTTSVNIANGAGNTTVTIKQGATTLSQITLTGTFNPNNFTFASDGVSGTNIGYHS